MDPQNSAPAQIPIRELAIRYHREGRFLEAIKAYRIAILLFPNDTTLSYNLGNLFRQIDQPLKAIACYELVLRLKENDLSALTNLAPLYRSGGQRDKAIDCYQRILAVSPNNATAQYFLDALYGKTPKRSPEAYVEQLFDLYAGNFDKHITEAVKYRGPQLLKQLWQECPSVPKSFPQAFDLGCGTGLGTAALARASARWIGVDLSAAMLDKAREKELYESLYHQDILSFVHQRKEQTRALVLMADVLPYFGDLDPLFAALSEKLTQSSCLLFSTEEGPKPIELQTCGRYRHSLQAVRSSFEAFGFRLSAYRSSSLRMQENSSVPSGLFLVSRT